MKSRRHVATPCGGLAQAPEVAGWQIYNPNAEDGSLVDDLLRTYHEIYQHRFATEPLVNHGLPIEVRAYRHYRAWRICLLLTPWHLARIIIPKTAPALDLPPQWSVAVRADADYVVIGPAVPLDILTAQERAHLNYQPRLGHYFVQPLIQSLRRFATADEVFEEWKEVIAVRDRNIAERKQHCEWQSEVSRREFFARLVRGARS
jgi:hypothetical protein